MSDYESTSGKHRPVWTVRFSPGTTLVGSLVGGAVAGLMLDFALIAGQNLDELAPTASVAKGALLVLGASILVFLVLGPILGWGLGRALRRTTNQNTHVLAFAALGALVGVSVGEYLGHLGGVSGLGVIAAPAVGIGAAIGRWSISSHSKS